MKPPKIYTVLTRALTLIICLFCVCGCKKGSSSNSSSIGHILEGHGDSVTSILNDLENGYYDESNPQEYQGNNPGSGSSSETEPVPEPGSLVLLGIGLGGLASNILLRRRNGGH